MHLPYFPYNASYSVVLKTENLLGNDGPEVLKYDIHLRFLNKEGTHYLIELTKTDVLFNEEEVQDAFNDILLLTAQAIDKVVVKVDGSGKAVGLANFEEIKTKWKMAREATESQYEGEVVTDYLNQMETNLASQEVTWKAINKSLLYTLLFHSLYREYGSNSSIEEKVHLHSLLPNQLVSLTVKQSVFQEKENEVFKIQMKGEQQEVHLEEETKHWLQENAYENRLGSALSQLEAFYLLSINGQLKEAYMWAEIVMDKVYRKRVEIELTEKK